MKRIKKYLDRVNNFVFGKSVDGFEDRLLLLSTLSLASILSISTFFNIILELKLSIILASGVGAVVYFSLYLFGRLQSRGRGLFLITSISTLLFVDLIWYVNYGSVVLSCPFLLSTFPF